MTRRALPGLLALGLFAAGCGADEEGGERTNTTRTVVRTTTVEAQAELTPTTTTAAAPGIDGRKRLS